MVIAISIGPRLSTGHGLAVVVHRLVARWFCDQRVSAILGRMHPGHAKEQAAPLIVTADEQLLEEIMRLCAAVGVTPVLAGDIPAARRAWGEASLVMVGADLAPALAHSAPGRREGVIVVAHTLGTLIWSAAVQLGAEHVLQLPADQGELIEALAGAMDGRSEACLVAVIGGVGGAGASTFAGALALAAAGRGLHALLVDADPFGGGIDILMGSEDVEGLRWPDVANAQGRISGDSLRRALPLHAGLSTLSWDRGEHLEANPAAMRSVLAAGRRSFEAMVVDVPRTFDETTLEVVSRSILTIVVLPENVRALGSAMRMLGRLQQAAGDVAVVTRTQPHGLNGQLLAARLGVPLLARVRSDRHLSAAIDAGYGPLAGRTKALRHGCSKVLDTLGLEAA